MEFRRLSLEELIENSGGKVITHAPAQSFEQIREVLGVPVDMLVKTMMFGVKHSDNQRFIVGAVRASDKIDMKKLGNATSMSRRLLSLVNEDEMEALTGMTLPELQPFGLDSRFSVVLDRDLMGAQTVFCNGGDPTHTLIIPTHNLRELSGGTVASIRVESEERRIVKAVSSELRKSSLYRS